MPIFVPFLLRDLSANVQKPENVVNEQTDGRTDERVAEEFYYVPSTWDRTKCGQK